MGDGVRGRLILGALISWIVPLVLTLTVGRAAGSYTVGFAVAGALPLAWTVVQWVRRRRVAWTGAIGVLAFAAASAAALMGGGSLGYKIDRPIIALAAGLALLVSAAAGKPLLGGLARGGRPTPAAAMRLTVVAGLALLTDATAHLILAATLPTVTFLVASRVVTVGEIALLLAARRLWGLRAPGAGDTTT